MKVGDKVRLSRAYKQRLCYLHGQAIKEGSPDGTFLTLLAVRECIGELMRIGHGHDYGAYDTHIHIVQWSNGITQGYDARYDVKQLTVVG